jgi:hypothetical protein
MTKSLKKNLELFLDEKKKNVYLGNISTFFYGERRGKVKELAIY